MKAMLRKSVVVIFIDSAVILGLLLAIPLMAQAQEEVVSPVYKKKFVVQWDIDNREEDVQYYQVYLAQGIIGDTAAEPQPYGEKILITGTEWDGKTVATQEVLIDVPADKDSEVWATVVAIDTSQNVSHFAKPWVGYRFMNEAPAEPAGLKGGPVTDASPQ